jgi:hypothetical protein
MIADFFEHDARVYVEVGRGVGADGHGDDFVAGIELMAATL